jgi:hypothetical protein
VEEVKNFNRIVDDLVDSNMPVASPLPHKKGPKVRAGWNDLPLQKLGRKNGRSI